MIKEDGVLLNVELTNEEIVEQIKLHHNEREYYALLLERNKRLIYKQASRYENVVRQHCFVDFDDLLQCGYFAILAAVKAYDRAKGFKFITFINLCYQTEVHAMFGNRRERRSEGYKRIFPSAAVSLNVPMDGDDYEMEEIDALEDEAAGRIQEDCEQQETRAIVAAAVERLPDRQRSVIQEIYYNDKPKTSLVDGVRFVNYSQVDSAVSSALLTLRRDKALRALYFGKFKEPVIPSAVGHTPENVVMAGQAMGEWLNYITITLERFQNGLQTDTHNRNRGIETV